MNYFEESLKLHKKDLDKIKVETKEDLSIVYTPSSVAYHCRKIFESEENVYKYT